MDHIPIITEGDCRPFKELEGFRSMTEYRRYMFLSLGLFLLVFGQTQLAQTFENPAGKVHSPLSMVKLMEEKLGAQFALQAGAVAKQATGQLTQDGKIVGRGTIISSKDARFSYLIFPADSLKHKWFTANNSASGEMLQRIENAPVQILSREDNLAIVRLVAIEDALPIEQALARTPVGLFIGFAKGGNKWSTGAVTNEARTAYTRVTASTHRALVKHWERIGLKVSAKRNGFPEVVETDLDLKPDEAGAPIFDRNGNWQGVAISRADQHSTFVIPASRVIRLVNRFEAAH